MPDSSAADAAVFHGSGHVLTRPADLMAWRGDKLLADLRALIDRIRGAANPGVRRV